MLVKLRLCQIAVGAFHVLFTAAKLMADLLAVMQRQCCRHFPRWRRWRQPHRLAGEYTIFAMTHSALKPVPMIMALRLLQSMVAPDQ